MKVAWSDAEIDFAELDFSQRDAQGLTVFVCPACAGYRATWANAGYSLYPLLLVHLLSFMVPAYRGARLVGDHE